MEGTEGPTPQELVHQILFEGWGVHYTRQVLLWLLVDAPDGISWPDGLGPAIAAADPEDLLARFIGSFESPKMVAEFKNWLLAAHIYWGMPLLKEVQDGLADP